MDVKINLHSHADDDFMVNYNNYMLYILYITYILYKIIYNNYNSNDNAILSSPVSIGGCVVGGVYPDHGTLEEIYQVARSSQFHWSGF